MSPELRILLVEDNAADAELEMRELTRSGLRVVHRVIETEEAFRAALSEFRPEVILSDFSMPHFDGMSALGLARELIPDVPFIFVSGTIGEENAISALTNGATDYVLKNNLVRLPPAVRRALRDTEQRALRAKMERELRESHARFQTLLEVAPDAIMLVDAAGAIVLGNAEMERVFGYRREDLLGKSVDMLVPELQRPDHEGHRLVYLADPETRRMAALSNLHGQREDGNLVPVEISLSPFVLNDETHVIAIVRDVSTRREQELKIARLNRIQEVLSGINSAIVRIHDRGELFHEVCRIAVEHGKFAMAWIGMVDEARSAIGPVAKAGREDGYLESIELTIESNAGDNLAMAVEAVARSVPVICNDIGTDPRMLPWRSAALERGYRSTAVLPLLREGRAVGVFALYAPEPAFFDEEEMRLLVEMANDVSFALDYIAKEEKLDYFAYYDQLTGLPNRALFNDRLDQRVAAARRDQKSFFVLMLDIERFRQINETLGRRAGDDLLRQFAGRLKSGIGEADTLAHLGGDYFVMATGGADDGNEVAHLLGRTLGSVSGAPFLVDGNELHIAPRAGIALHPADGVGADELLKNAEAALKNAKTTGQRYQFYAPQMNARVAGQLKLENELRRAVQEEQFVLYYQPRLELSSRKICGLEALIRWIHPERGLVTPGEFIPVLENTGMILEVGRWALRRAALDHSSWHKAGLEPPRIAVNVSAIQLRRKEFVEEVRAALAEAGDSREWLDIEITESMLMEDIEGSIDRLKEVQAMGVHVAMDDFGTGYSSLSNLTRLPINSVKVDRSFISQMTTRPEQLAIVTTVISLAGALNLPVVAEGVETEEQAKLLRLLRCDEVQGYLFGKPMSYGAIEDLLRRK